MEIKTDRYKETARRELANPDTQKFLSFFPLVLSARRTLTLATLPDPEAALALAAAIRAEVVERLPDLLEEFEKNATANGARVVWARDSAEANRYILELAREKKVTCVTKGKSMVSEEMGLREELQKAGLEVWESDLGEFITQLLELPPFHIIGPAINVPVERVRDIFMEKAGLTEPTNDPVQLGQAARKFLREKFHRAEMGITGVNIAVAETGTLINVENEGNIRHCKSGPRIQVSVLTLEKLAPTMKDAVHMLRILCMCATGQRLGTYASLDSGPRKAGEMDGPEELHIVILDNGRSAIHADPETRDALRCVRCAACLSVCPVYGKIGGYPYGWAYSGPMGQVLNPLLLGLDRAEDLVWSCTLCQRCKGACPAGIDHPRMLLYYRSLQAQGSEAFGAGGAGLAEKALQRLYAVAAGNPGFWKVFATAARLAANLNERDGKISRMPGPVKGWFQVRDLPPFPGKTFHDRWKELEREG
ncbi:MAG: lactate utilization protein B [bacterium]